MTGASKAKAIHHLIEGSTIFILGILLLWKRTDFLLPVLWIVALLVAIGGIAQIVNWVIQKPKKKLSLFIAFLYLSLGVILVLFPQIPVFIIPVLFSAYLMLNGVVKLADTILIIKDKGEDLLYSLIPGLFYMTFAFILLFAPNYHITTVLICLGIYCVMLGFTYIMDFVRTIIPVKAQQKIRRRFRMTLPIFLAAFIPHSVLTRLNEYLSSGGRKAGEYQDIALKKTDEHPDLEIFIHVAADHFFMTIGHCDIWFDNELIAYGNYDEASQLPIGMGPGVLLISNKYQYLPFCLKFNKTTIFSFGLRLNEEQKEAVRARIREIKTNLVPWNPEENPANKEIFGAQLKRKYQAEFFKFKRGKFKTYFVMSTNCVLLIDSIVCRAGTDILNVNGIISPGTFYDYLEAEFLKKDSMVITRNVYRLPLTEEELRNAEFAPPTVVPSESGDSVLET